MAIITLTHMFSGFQDWPGRLFQAQSDTTVVTRADGRMVIRLGENSGEFANHRIEIIGSDFEYDGGEPISGKMTTLRILNPFGDTVITFASLGKNTLANDLSQFYTSMFGTEGDDGDGISIQNETAWSNLMSGKDTIKGAVGSDFNGLPGMDPGNDKYNMGGGDDWINASLGDDTIDGGDGWDILNFGETKYTAGVPAVRGAVVNLQTGVVQDVWGGRDQVSNLEEVRGSRYNDEIIGADTKNDRFSGGRGRDTMDGGANTFTATGDRDEDRRDEVRYDRDARDGGRRGIVVDLETDFADNSITGQIRDGFGNLDTVIDIERVVGTKFNDSFVGSRMNNVFAGGEGVDSYVGEDGWDSVVFGRWFGNNNGPTAGLRVDMTKASGQVMNDGFGNTETMSGIESIVGTNLGDSVKGNGEENEFILREGRDTMTGGAGTDYFAWEEDEHLGQGDRVTDFKASGADADKLAFWVAGIDGMTETVTLVNGTQAATAGVGTFIFNAANDTLFWDADGRGGDAAIAVAVLTGVNALTVDNFDMWT